MFENPRRGRQARNFGKNIPKIVDLKLSSEQLFSQNCRWVPLTIIKQDQVTTIATAMRTSKKAKYTLLPLLRLFEQSFSIDLPYFISCFPVKLF